MDEANRLARTGAVIELLTCVLNGLASMTWLMVLALFLVGFLWTVPLALVALEVCLAGFVLVAGQNRFGWAGPAIGLFVSLCNLNPMGVMMSVVCLRFQLKATAAAHA
ncbi:MAG: hypothetical protein ABMA64_25050 [Myxococcota bacterium]